MVYPLTRGNSEGLNVGRWKCGNVKKLKMTEPFLGNGSLILDDGISGTRADSMDPGGSGDFGFGPSGVVRGQNRSTKRADQTESPSLSARLVFQLTPEEKKGVIAKCDNPAKVLYFRGLPMALTEHGALMASMVLNSPRAMEMSVFVIRAFVGMRKEMSRNEEVLRRLAEMDQTLLLHDEGLRDLYQKLMPLLDPRPEVEKRKIGFGDGD